MFEGVEYRIAIVDECGDIVRWCSNLSVAEIDDILSNHPEWHKECVLIGG